jgi:hypothetical protein
VRAGCRGQTINRAAVRGARQRNDELGALVEADLWESDAGELALKALGVVELVFCFSVMAGLDPAIHENTAASA